LCAPFLVTPLTPLTPLAPLAPLTPLTFQDHTADEVKFKVVYIGKRVGFGVVAIDKIPAGTYLINYVGVRIDDKAIDSQRRISYLWQVVNCTLDPNVPFYS
jgi:hypothetical protein